jgi:aminoglycoside phosphotransferase (APT) family kinase protein
MAQDLQDAGAGVMLAEALAQVPGYRAADPAVETRHLPGGSVNRSYQVTTGAGRFVLRLSAGSDAWLTSDRSVERLMQRIAASAGLAPRIVAADAADRWLITEYVEGRLWTEVQFSDPASIAMLGAALQRLHALPTPEQGHFPLLQILREYVRRLEGGAGELAGYLEPARSAWRASGADGRPAAILHHDLNAANIIQQPAGVVLIDWECAACGDPLQDVACILSYYEAARRHSRLLLEAIGLTGVTPSQLQAAVWLFDLHTYLWYRERRTRLTASGAEMEAEQRLATRLTRRA